MSQYRAVDEWERGLVERLLQESFPGAAELRAQFQGARARTIDDEGSLEFESQTGDAAPVRRRIPIEAEATDTDGVVVHFLVHVVDGRLRELEIFKEDGSAVVTQFRPSDLTIIDLDRL
jgi:hypothetical protein